jgi:hypothetical protein
LKSFAVLLVALLLFVAGCGGNDDDGGSSTVTPPPATTPSPSGTTTSSGATATQPPASEETSTTERDRTEPTRTRTGQSKDTGTSKGTGSTVDSRRVERYLRDNFGGAGGESKSAWYGHVVEIVVSGATTTIKTDLSGNRAGKRNARQICVAVRGSIPGITDSVRVTALAGTTLAKCVP